jgi:hypothetical protein
MIDVTNLLLTGYYKELKLGVRFCFDKANTSKLVKKFTNGISVGFETEIDNIVFDVGNDDQENIVYFLTKINKQKEKLFFHADNHRVLLNDVDMSLFIKILDAEKIDWVFSRCWDKLIYISIIKSKVELCFAFYDD